MAHDFGVKAFEHKLVPGREEEAVNRAVDRLIAAVGALSRADPDWREKLHTLLPPYSEPWELAFARVAPRVSDHAADDDAGAA